MTFFMARGIVSANVTTQIGSAALGLGFALGLRHALDADHIAAVSTLVSESRSVWRSSLVGTSWGVGHTAALLAAGIAVIGLKLTIPPTVARSMETAVAIMLVLLGARAVQTALRGWKIHRHAHSHEGSTHVHFHVHAPWRVSPHEHEHRHLLGVAARPFLVGVVHGLAGSAGLMLLVVSTITSVLGGLIFIVVFGLGATAGMLLMSGLVSVPFVCARVRSQGLMQGLQLIVGCGSVLFGCLYGLALAH
jgi:high-affinity nickel permease